MARAEKVDWERLRLEFVTDPDKPSVSVFFRERNLTSKTYLNRASQEKWKELRERHWESVTAQAAPVIAEMQAGVLARDTASRLSEIRAMADHAYRAIVPEAGEGLAYDKPGDAVLAYERLTKLERLLTDQSTENISVHDARQLVDDVLTVLEEVLSDHPDAFEQVSTRLADLRPHAGTSQGPLEA